MSPKILSLFFLALLAGSTARAQTRGFGVARYTPTSAGEWSFWVDHPWYNRVRPFALGVTVDYAHDPLVFGTRQGSNFTELGVVISDQVITHFDLAVALLDRIQLSFSLPLIVYEGGHQTFGVGPRGDIGLGDPNVGVMLRLYGQPYHDAFSIHLGGRVWIPIGEESTHAGDSGVRGLPKLVLGGLSHHVLWSLTAGYLYRRTATIGTLPNASGGTVGPELHLGAALAYADLEHRFSIGPEAMLATTIENGHAFDRDFTTLEILGGIHYNIGGWVQLGLGAGVGALREPGSPDYRLLFRLAIAPMENKMDADGDGIVDGYDACPNEPGPSSIDPRLNGCPDKDRDGVMDAEDLCPDLAKGDHPDPSRLGCPIKDRDGDGVFDADDQCVDVPAGPTPDPAKPGCPLKDRDGDGVSDSEDQCIDIPAGPHPDPQKKGCPIADRDGDTVPDDVDACPDKPGAPSSDPKKNGCPGLVQVKGGKLEILKPVFFATNKDVILPKSFPVLTAVADALKVSPELKRIAVEGHTDNRGKPEKNLNLSERRAQSVMRWLTEHGVEASRLEAHGYGQERPVASNKTSRGRSENRRVEFRIVDDQATEPGSRP